jgi:small subunit ribosomal protein S19e
LSKIYGKGGFNMTKVYDVPASILINRVSEELKKIENIKQPDWAAYVKTGADREKAPENEDWWYTRSASILRKIYIYGPVGIPTLRRLYGGKKNMGYKPERKRGGSGSVISEILKQLEEAGLVEKTDKGRVLTNKGISFMDRISHQIKKEIPELSKY